MTRYLKLFVCLAATLTATALAQTTDQPETTKTTSPVAYVYVSGPTNIEAFAASSTGTLTPVSGSPFPGSLSHMSVNKTYLFGAGRVEFYRFLSPSALRRQRNQCSEVQSLQLRQHRTNANRLYRHNLVQPGELAFQVTVSASIRGTANLEFSTSMLILGHRFSVRQTVCLGLLSLLSNPVPS